jgi:hypothetical protein
MSSYLHDRISLQDNNHPQATLGIVYHVSVHSLKQNLILSECPPKEHRLTGYLFKSMVTHTQPRALSFVPVFLLFQELSVFVGQDLGETKVIYRLIYAKSCRGF